MKALLRPILFSAALLTLQTPVLANPAQEAQLLQQIQSGQIGNRVNEQRQLATFKSASPAQRQALLAAAREQRDALREHSRELEISARENGKQYQAKINALSAALGANASMPASLQQLAGELTGIFRGSPTSLEFPERQAWLAEFSAKMAKSSEIFSLEELEQLWVLLQQEITASGQINRVSAEVLGAEGQRQTIEVARLGKFALISDEPEAAYLSWQTDSQRASILKRQPEGAALAQLRDYLRSNDSVAAVSIDPTAGPLLNRLVDSPALSDRIRAGGLIGNLILLLGAVGISMAVYKLISIFLLSQKVNAQRQDLANPRDDNPLGRLLQIYERNQNVDTDTLEMRLGEAILQERPKIDRFIGSIKVISAVAPLMGLMGTVIGMIATFQAITLFGTGDPKTMAGGISQALVTTVEGLTVAIPTVLLYAIVNARALSLMNTLKQQTAGLIAERMEARAAERS